MQHHLSWMFLKTINASIMTDINALFSGILGYQFKLDMIVPQRSKKAPKTSEVITVSLPFLIL